MGNRRVRGGEVEVSPGAQESSGEGPCERGGSAMGPSLLRAGAHQEELSAPRTRSRAGGLWDRASSPPGSQKAPGTSQVVAKTTEKLDIEKRDLRRPSLFREEQLGCRSGLWADAGHSGSPGPGLLCGSRGDRPRGAFIYTDRLPDQGPLCWGPWPWPGACRLSRSSARAGEGSAATAALTPPGPRVEP